VPEVDNVELYGLQLPLDTVALAVPAVGVPEQEDTRVPVTATFFVVAPVLANVTLPVKGPPLAGPTKRTWTDELINVPTAAVLVLTVKLVTQVLPLKTWKFEGAVTVTPAVRP
jgi:hypothetical protein